MTKLTASEILELYDEELKVAIESGEGMTRFEKTSHVVRGLGVGTEAFANFVKLQTMECPTELIHNEVNYFTSLARQFRWIVRSDLSPAGLVEALLARGFKQVSDDQILVLRVADYPGFRENLKIKVRELDIEDIPQMMSVQYAVWKEHFDVQAFGRSLAERKRRESGRLFLYGAFTDEVMVSCAWLRADSTPSDSQFAYLCGGTTLPEHRQIGAYRALIEARLQKARELGRRFLVVDAGEMSRPILEKMGFQFLRGIRDFQSPSSV